MDKKVLVIHPEDPSTDFLCKIYDGKGYDVLRHPHIFESIDLARMIDEHDKIIMLGHGTPSGLINVDYWFGSSEHDFFKSREYRPYIVGDKFAYFLNKKETVSIWCNSDQFYKRNKIGHGELHTGMIISETSEQMYVLGKVYLDEEEQLENMNRFATVVGECIEMEDYAEMQDYILNHYTGDDPVTQFNRNNILLI